MYIYYYFFQDICTNQILYANCWWLTLYFCLQSYLFLLSSDYERSEWRESIQKLQKKGTSGSVPLTCALATKKAFVCCSPNGIAAKNKGLFRCAVALCLPDLQTCVLSSVELQVLTSSCFKLRTVHNIPVTSNKDGKKKRGGRGGGKKPFIHLSLLFPSFMFSYFLCFSSTHFIFLCLCFELNLRQKSTFDRLSARIRVRGGVAGENVVYNMFLIQCGAAGATQWVGAQLLAPPSSHLPQILRMPGSRSPPVTLKPSG